MECWLICSLLSFFNNALTYSFIIFFPLFANNKCISQTIIGIVYSFLSIGLIIPIFFLKHINLTIHKIIGIAISFQITLILMNFSYFIQSKFIFSIYSIIIALMIGIFHSILQGIAYGTVPKIYKDDKIAQQKKLFLTKLFGFSGTPCSTIIGGFLFGKFKIFGVFLFFPTLYFMFIISILIFRIDIKKLEPTKKEIKFTFLFRNWKIFVQFAFISFSYSFAHFAQVGYSINMKETFNFDNEISSFYFSINGISIFFTSIILIFLSKFQINNLIIQIGYIVGVISLIFIGPCQFLGIPNNLLIICIGISFLGINYSIINTSSIIYLANWILDFGNYENVNIDSVSLISAYIIGNIEGLTSIYASIIAGCINDNIGFKNGMSLVSIFLLSVFICYIFIEGRFFTQKDLQLKKLIEIPLINLENKIN